MSMHTEARCLANPAAQKKLARALNASTRAAGRYKQMDDHHRENKRSIRNRGALIPSVIYLACRHDGVAHTLKELSAHLDPEKVTKKDVGKTFKKCQEVLNLNVGPAKAKDLIERFCNYCFKISNNAKRSEQTKRGKCVVPLWPRAPGRGSRCSVSVVPYSWRESGSIGRSSESR
jgi:hypothetical protein